MNKQEVYAFIKNKGIWYEITEHNAVCTMEELKSVDLPYPEADAKNIFVRDDKKQNYYLISVKSDKRVDLKEFKKKYDTRHLSFAQPEDLWDILQLVPGSVTPLGVLNDTENKVKVYIDNDFVDVGIIGVHPNENTATLWLKTLDLIDIIKESGHEVYIAEI